MEKTANLSCVLMCVCDKHFLFFAVTPSFLLHQNLRNESSFCWHGCSSKLFLVFDRAKYFEPFRWVWKLDSFRKFWCKRNEGVTAKNKKCLSQTHMSTQDRFAVFSMNSGHVWLKFWKQIE